MKAEGWAKFAIIYDVFMEINVRKKNSYVIAKVQILWICKDELSLSSFSILCDGLWCD